MRVFEEKKNTHLVIKREDIDKYLSPKEKEDFLYLDYLIAARKIMEEQKDPNSYYVVNKDEPYADKILEVIKQGETNKC